MALTVLEEILPYTPGCPVPRAAALHNKALYNTLRAGRRRQAGRLRWQNARFFGRRHHYEPRWFKPWPAGRATTVSVLGQQVPLGDIFFDCSGVRIGFEICEDAWVAQRRGAELALTVWI